MNGKKVGCYVDYLQKMIKNNTIFIYFFIYVGVTAVFWPTNKYK